MLASQGLQGLNLAVRSCLKGAALQLRLIQLACTMLTLLRS